MAHKVPCLAGLTDYSKAAQSSHSLSCSEYGCCSWRLTGLYWSSQVWFVLLGPGLVCFELVLSVLVWPRQPPPSALWGVHDELLLGGVIVDDNIFRWVMELTLSQAESCYKQLWQNLFSFSAWLNEKPPSKDKDHGVNKSNAVLWLFYSSRSDHVCQESHSYRPCSLTVNMQAVMCYRSRTLIKHMHVYIHLTNNTKWSWQLSHI